MNDCLAHYIHEAERQSAPAQCSALKTEAIANLKRFDFPSKSDEAWKYTAPAVFTATRFSTAHQINLPNTNLPFDAWQIGHATDYPEGLIVLPWQDALNQHAEKIAPHLGRILQPRHGFHAQNMAMFQAGYFIYVPKGMKLDKPLYFYHQAIAETAYYMRHLVVLEEDASAILFEDYTGESDSYFVNSNTEIFLSPRATFKHYKIQRESKHAFHVSEVAALQEETSVFESHVLSLGAQWARSDTFITLSKPYARCLMNGLYVTAEKQWVDHHTNVSHLAHHTESVQDYKGMVYDASHAVFNGAVYVDQAAQQTVAQQQNKNLLFSSSAEIDTKPELSIFADDVVCSHGATVGQLDEEALFYLASRGIQSDQAVQYLVQAFIHDNLTAMDKAMFSDLVFAKIKKLVS